MPTTHTDKSRVVIPFRAPVPAPMPLPPPTPLLNKFTGHVGRAKSAVAILDGLDEFASRLLPVNVLGVGRMPQRTADWRSIELGKDVFLHRSAPVDWWNEYAAKAAGGYDPGIMSLTGATNDFGQASVAVAADSRMSDGTGCTAACEAPRTASIPRGTNRMRGGGLPQSAGFGRPGPIPALS